MQHHSSAALGAERQAFIALLIGGIAWAGTAHADVTVCATGCTYPNIQTAVTNTADGETIQIKAGIYPERLTIENKSLKLIGDGASVTVIDGTSQNNGKRVIALACTEPKRIVISDVTVTGGLNGSGGIQNDGCKVSLEFSHVINNSARHGGGILNAGAFAVFKSTISDNHASLSGGGILSGGELEITDSIIDKNSARKNGGGGVENSGRMTIVRSTISNNEARLGGGIANTTLGNGVVRKSILSNNIARSKGGGVYNARDLELVGTLVIANEAKTAAGEGQRGGGIFVTRNIASEGGGLFNEGAVTSRGSTTSANTPDDCLGTSCF